MILFLTYTHKHTDRKNRKVSIYGFIWFIRQEKRHNKLKFSQERQKGREGNSFGLLCMLQRFVLLL